MTELRKENPPSGAALAGSGGEKNMLNPSNLPHAERSAKSTAEMRERTADVLHLPGKGRFSRYVGMWFAKYLLPVEPGQKAPSTLDKGTGIWSRTKGWQDREATAADLAEWDTWDCAVGIRLGEIVALDLDTYGAEERDAALRDGLVDIVRDVLECAPPVRGRPGTNRCALFLRVVLAEGEAPLRKTAIPFHSPATDPTAKVDHGKLETLAKGQQALLHGRHESGSWYGFDIGFGDTDPSYALHEADIPAATPAQVAEIQCRYATFVQGTGRIVGVITSSSGTSSAERKEIGDARFLAPGFEAEEVAAEDWERLRSALFAIPNVTPDYNEWEPLVRAAKAACGGREEFYPVVAAWSAQCGENTEEMTRGRWDSQDTSSIGWIRVRELALKHGWKNPHPEPAADDFEPVTEPETAAQKARREFEERRKAMLGSGGFCLVNHTAENAPALAQQPPTPWVMGRTAIRGVMTVIAGPGGASKTSYALARSVCIASGMPLLGEKVVRRGRVLIWCAEDEMAIITKRVMAFCERYELDYFNDVAPFVTYVDTAGERRSLMIKGDHGRPERTPDFDRLEQIIVEGGYKHLVLDTLSKLSIGLDGNSAMEGGILSSELASMARRLGISVDLIAHTNKSGSGDHGSANAVSGTAAIVNDSRITLTVMKLTAKEKKDRGLTGSVVMVEGAKANYSPDKSGASDELLYELVDFDCGNSTPDPEVEGGAADSDRVAVYRQITMEERLRGDPRAMQAEADAAENERQATLRRVFDALGGREAELLNRLVPLVGKAADLKDSQTRADIANALYLPPNATEGIPAEIIVAGTTYELWLTRTKASATSPQTVRCRKAGALPAAAGQ
ncbi:hypothetical protein GCM10011611_26340 [Aliidongia dinghuensis]|uniref:Primase C-terminal 2 domain-containing protein n=1 Tax=Aliidongia dinghuensis TaxID=1867774 RepID=A0A8J2YTQ0_9PROT|nr:AAA family ATPase [Aliidongia dinghuensis]GGF19186.1 hypothetical protein GCM10011611_26340 [Aliidongia dinghuensis]